MDIVGPLPSTPDGFRYILTFIDHMTGWPEAVPLKSATAESVSLALLETIVCRFGMPERLLTDNGTHFDAKLMEELYERLSIKKEYCTTLPPTG